MFKPESGHVVLIAHRKHYETKHFGFIIGFSCLEPSIIYVKGTSLEAVFIFKLKGFKVKPLSSEVVLLNIAVYFRSLEFSICYRIRIGP